MNKKDFKKQFINEFKKENDLKLTFKDTFNNEEINQKNYQHEYLSLKRRFKLTALCSCILICFLVVGLCITLKLYKDNINNTDDYGFTQEELKFINENSDLFNEIPKAELNIIDNQSIVIYDFIKIYFRMSI